VKIESICEQGSGAVNEDVTGWNGNRFWVLDGATAGPHKRFFGGESDAKWLAGAFSDALSKENETGLPNTELCSRAMGRVRGELGERGAGALAETVLKPSFAMVIANIAEEIEISCLSDCAAAVWGRGSVTPELFTDRRVEKAGKRTRRVLDYIKANDIPKDRAKALVFRQITKNRRLMNAENGYWVGTLDGSAFARACNWKIAARDITELLLCSDGFARLFDYGIISLGDFFANEVPLKEAVGLLRNHETAMPEGSEFKRHDDAAAVRIRF